MASYPSRGSLAPWPRCESTGAIRAGRQRASHANDDRPLRARPEQSLIDRGMPGYTECKQTVLLCK